MDAAIRVAELRASRGVAWLAESFHVFKRAPLAWIGLSAGWLGITLALFFKVPFIGEVLANFLQPVFFASFAIAARKQSNGEKIVMADLFAGFRRNWRALVNVGAIMLLVQFLVLLVLAMFGLSLAAPPDREMTVADVAQMFQGKEWLLVAAIVLTAIVKGAFWFAPALIAFHDMPTLHAIRWSVYAALANVGAMVTYVAALTLLFLVGMIPWLVGLLVVIPMMVISTFVGYREVFEAPAPAVADPESA